MQSAFVLRISVFVSVSSYYVHGISLVSLVFSFLVTLGFSLALSVLQCLIPCVFVTFLSESVYRLPGMYVISSCQFEFVVKSVSQCRLVVGLVFKSRCLVSFLGTVVCSVEFCIVLDLIGFRVLTFNRKGRSVLKKGRDGRTSSTSCYSVTENCYPVLGSLNPHPKPQQKKNLFGSVSVRSVSHTVICLSSCRNVWSPSLGLKSESVSPCCPSRMSPS
jgi:hypothetical protein